MQSLNLAWRAALRDIIQHGQEVAPRGQRTKEILQRTMVVDMRKPVLTTPLRKLSYQFMAAEAYWILSGDNRVATIAPYNQRISQFSDDGVTFFGAYGPRISEQLPYVAAKLLEDRDTRQAGLTIWRESPPTTKDVPCTVSIFFNVRAGKLNCHVFMRSSDIWLGIPYDVFNFSMLSHALCAIVHQLDVSPGALYLTAASQHLYCRDLVKAEECIWAEPGVAQPPTPEALYRSNVVLMEWLKELRETKKGDQRRWWEVGHEPA